MWIEETTRTEKRLLTTRVFDAPQQLVYEAWTNTHHLEQWFGPKGFTITTRRFAAEVGGEWEFIMHGPDGTDFYNLIRFTKLQPYSTIEYQQMGDGSQEDDTFFVVVNLSEADGKTKFVMDMTFKSKDYLDMVIEKYGALEGQKETLNRLRNYLSAMINNQQ